VHSYIYPAHELALGQLAREVGFTQISLSAQLLPLINMVPRGVSSTAHAYGPCITVSDADIGKYLEGFFTGFDERLRGRGAGAGGRAPAHPPGGKSGGVGEGKGRE
jgi:5-oxoprolinase (ATP-hydrolysing)